MTAKQADDLQRQTKNASTSVFGRISLSRYEYHIEAPKRFMSTSTLSTAPLIVAFLKKKYGKKINGFCGWKQAALKAWQRTFAENRRDSNRFELLPVKRRHDASPHNASIIHHKTSRRVVTSKNDTSPQTIDAS
jgi:hypothetical protein